MNCSECGERNPETANKCLHCGAYISPDPAEEGTVSSKTLLILGGLMMIAAVAFAGYAWWTTASGARAVKTSTWGTDLETICVPRSERAEIDRLQREGWTRSSGGFVDEGEASKVCLQRTVSP